MQTQVREIEKEGEPEGMDGDGNGIGVEETESGAALPATGAERERQGEEGVFSWEHGADVEPWPEPVDGVELLNALAAFLTRYVVLVKFAAETLALWVLHTYAFRLRDVTTYIGLESPQKRCGKTTLLTALSEVVNRPVVASNISSPAFFRVIEEMRPTLMIDEADTVLNRNDELRGILNSGYKRKTAYVVRVTNEPRSSAHAEGTAELAERRNESQVEGKGGGPRLARFSSWCPKVIATIKHLPETLADRCIVIAMHRKKASERCERLKGVDATELSRKCARFVMDHREEIADAEPKIPADLHDRAADIWEPLLVLADLAGGDWPERAREAALGLTASGQEEGPGALFFDIFILFLRGNWERVFSRTLVAELNGLGDRPWVVLRQGKEITELWLARQLRPYGVRPKTMWIGKDVAKGYFKDDFQEIFHRYIPKAQAQALLDELKVSNQPPNADEDSVSNQGQNGGAGKKGAEAGKDCGGA